MGKDIRGLFLAHRRELLAYITKKLGNAEAAADLTQETFLRFVEHRDCNPAAVIAHERAYLYRTAYHLTVDHLRRERREQAGAASDKEFEAVLDDRPSPERTAGGRHELSMVTVAVRELPQRTQQVLSLARVEGLTYREVAKRLDISESSVQKHLAKATQHLMRRLRNC